MPISEDQRKLLTTVEDSICAVLYAFYGVFSISYRLIRRPGSIGETFTDENRALIVPSPLTYLAASSFVFALCLKFLPYIVTIAGRVVHPVNLLI